MIITGPELIAQIIISWFSNGETLHSCCEPDHAMSHHITYLKLKDFSFLSSSEQI